MTTHHYSTLLKWTGSTGAGYDNYSREHTVARGVGQQELTMSSDPAFRGDPELLNPEELLLAAASSCQMLSFLAIAARSRIDVVAYDDNATAEMPEDEKPIRITRIRLMPQIVISGAGEDRIPRLVQLAHQECFIANTLNAAIEIDPTIVVQ